MHLTVEFDLAELHQGLQKIETALGDGLHHAVSVAVDEGTAEARDHHAYHDRSGELTKSIRGEMLMVSRGSAEGEIVAGEGPSGRYIKIVEGGSKPHDIRPKEGHRFVGPLQPGQSRRKKDDIGTHRIALRFMGKNGLIQFRAVVHHPGTRAYGFMGAAYLKAERVLEREVDTMVAKAVER